MTLTHTALPNGRHAFHLEFDRDDISVIDKSGFAQVFADYCISDRERTYGRLKNLTIVAGEIAKAERDLEVQKLETRWKNGDRV